MRRVLLDNDVILDVILDREPFVEAAAALWERHRNGDFDGLIAAITPINVFYITRKLKDAKVAREAVEKLLATFEICAVNSAVLRAAISSPLRDYEDAVQYESALSAAADAIVTRNSADFANASLPVYSPTEFLLRFPDR